MNPTATELKILDVYSIAAESRHLEPIPDDYQWQLFELFFDGYIVHQQSTLGIHFEAELPPDFEAQTILMAFDGTPVFAFDVGQQQELFNRLCCPILHYLPENLQHIKLLTSDFIRAISC